MTRVLIVEDEELFRDNVREMLGFCSYSVIGASTIADAITALEASSFDVLLLDASLPDGRAEDLLERLARRGLTARVAVITGTCDGDRWMKLGPLADMIVPKPVSLATVRQIAAPRRPPA